MFGGGKVSYYLDGLSEPENWMKFVNCARHSGEQNVALVQHGDHLYYECCRDISKGEELLVWYGNSYKFSMGIPIGLNAVLEKEEIKPDKSLTGMLYLKRMIREKLTSVSLKPSSDKIYQEKKATIYIAFMRHRLLLNTS